MTPLFSGTIQDGKLSLDKGQSFREYLQGLNGKRVTVTVERVTHKRTIPQNKWYWGVAVKLISEHTGYYPDEVHDALKHAFAPKVIIGNLVAVKSTKHLDTVEFGDNMMERVVRWAAEELHIVIPLPEEVDV